MDDDNEHAAAVDRWMARIASGLRPDELLVAFERAFRAVWRRAQLTLGDVTLEAVGDRVLADAATRFPMLASARLELDGISCDDMRRDGGLDDRDRIAEAVRFVLVELLSVIGRLTGDVLSPALHAELERDVEGDRGHAT